MPTTSDEAPGIVGREPAPAKINLALHVRRRRPDGYHDLDSLVVFAPPFDEVEFAPAPGNDISLMVEGPFAPSLAGTATANNLVVRAARLMADAAGYRAGIWLRLTKRIPIGAGLGGGSADAAATLRLLHRQWHDRVTAAEVAGLAEQLGADVPMCLQSRPLRAEGKGERLSPIAGFPALWLVLVHPGVAIGTPAVFGRLSNPADPPLPALPDRVRLTPSDVISSLAASTNGLTAAACAESPAVEEVLGALARQPGCQIGRMSGSGSACFGLFADRDTAGKAAENIAKSRPAWWVSATATLPS